MQAAPQGLPSGVTVFERGWLSANNILFVGAQGTALVDSGYVTHSDQTLALVTSALGDRPLDLLVNTHLHSDHCGGNAALQGRYPRVQTLIPPGQADAVRRWDEEALILAPTGQLCARFAFDDVLRPGTELQLGDARWQVHAAPGHDPHSVILFEPSSKTLISADALWENGFGIVFPELEGIEAFDDVGRTLDLIESLQPATIIPGHGRVFSDLEAALATARRRLEGFIGSPIKHLTHAAKVLLKYKLLEFQSIGHSEFMAWARSTRFFTTTHERAFAELTLDAWLEGLLQDLARSGVARLTDGQVINQ